MSNKKKNTKTKQRKKERRIQNESIKKESTQEKEFTEASVDDAEEMSLEDHFRELKQRFVVCILCFVALFVFFYLNSEPVIMKFIETGKNIGYEMIYISPQEILVEELRLAGLLALVCDSPIILYEVMRFIAPAFHRAGKKLCFIGVSFLGLFFLGAFFSYKVLIPFTYGTLYKIGISTGILAQITVHNYISLFLTFLLCLGIVFEMPLITSGLTIVHILDADKMKKAFQPMIVVILIISALITPPDVVSQCVVAIPMIVLYVVSIGLCKILEKEKTV